jgi:hypothetical protein
MKSASSGQAFTTKPRLRIWSEGAPVAELLQALAPR